MPENVVAFHTPGGNVAEILKPLGVSLGESLKSTLSPCFWLLCLGQLLTKPRGVDPIKFLRLLKLSVTVKIKIT